MNVSTHYLYPGDAAEFGPYNFHQPAVINELAALLVSTNPKSPRVIELIGPQHSGRHYLLRAATFHARQQGEPSAVVSLHLTGYEPDQSLRQLVAHLAKNLEDEQSAKILDLAKRAKLELKVTPLTFLVASLAIKWDPSLEDLGRLLGSAPNPIGPEMSTREQLRALLERATHGQRVILHVRDAQTLDVGLRTRLLDETRLNPKLYIALSYLRAGAQIVETDHRTHRVFVPKWTREEMGQAISRKAASSRIPGEFLDFLWASSSQTRESLAGLLLRIARKPNLSVVASVDEMGAWTIGDRWLRNKHLMDELARDLFDPIDDLLARVPIDDQRLLRQFLNEAALCDPTIPPKHILATLNLGEKSADDVLDQIDDLFGEDGRVRVFRDLGFSNPGFARDALVYRFLNPALPGVILMRCSDAREPATRLLNHLVGSLPPNSRAIARLYLRLAEAAGSTGQAEGFANQLLWWTSADDCERLMEAVLKSLNDGEVSPFAVWKVVESSVTTWPPARRMALVIAYGKQTGGVRSDELFQFLTTRADLLLDLGAYEQACSVAMEALSAPLPKPEWVPRVHARNLAGLAFYRLGRLAEAKAHFEDCLADAKSHLDPDHLAIMSLEDNLGLVYLKQGRYEQAELLHKRALAIRRHDLGPDHPDTLNSFHNMAVLYVLRGQYEQAEPLLVRVLAVREHTQGAEHLDTLASVSELARLYERQGRYEEAELLYVRALTSCERAHGVEHPGTLAAIDGLAGLHLKRGRYDQAELLYTRALAEREHKLGLEHSETLDSAHNLAVLREKQGRYSEAETLYVRVLAARERILGAEHPETLISINELAGCYAMQGRYSQAEKLAVRALAERERVLGPEHPDTLRSVSGLAVVYARQGRYREAEPLLVRALTAREHLLGPEHPDTLNSVSSLAGLHGYQGRYRQAEDLFVRALTSSEHVLGAEHPSTLNLLTSLAELLRLQGRYEQAEALLLQAFATIEHVLGAEHPDALSAVSNLAGIYATQGRYEQAEPLFLRVLAVRERTLGAEHPDTLTSLNNLAELYTLNGQHAHADRLYSRALAGRDSVLGAQHPDTLASINGIARLFAAQGRTNEAEPLFLRALAVCEQVLGAEHPHTLDAVFDLAELYASQTRYEQAESLFVVALKGRERVLGAEHPKTLRSAKCLAECYTSQGRHGEAEPSLSRVMAVSKPETVEYPDTGYSRDDPSDVDDPHRR